MDWFWAVHPGWRREGRLYGAGGWVDVTMGTYGNSLLGISILSVTMKTESSGGRENRRGGTGSL